MASLQMFWKMVRSCKSVNKGRQYDSQHWKNTQIKQWSTKHYT